MKTCIYYLTDSNYLGLSDYCVQSIQAQKQKINNPNKVIVHFRILIFRLKLSSFPNCSLYNLIISLLMANQEICINRKKENFRKKKRIVKKSMRNQPNVRHESAPASVVSDKKARREARKMEVKQQKKAEKQKKRENKMDEEEK